MKKDDESREEGLIRVIEGCEKEGVSRRDFMKEMAVGGLALAAATTGTTALFGARDVRAAAPKKGGRLRFAWSVHGPQDTLDPALNSTTLDYLRSRCYFNNLVQFRDDLSLKPELAEEWSLSANGREWTFKLRKGVEWHDGSKLNADDVVYSMMRHLGEKSVSRGKSLVNFVTQWEKIDASTVKAILAYPNADLPAILATYYFRIVKNNAENIPGYFKQPVGTGPFKSVEFTPGVRALGVRNPNYFGGEVYLDEIETIAITDPAARVNALISGQVDMIGSVPPNAIPQINAKESVELWSVPSCSMPQVVMMQDREPGINPDFVAGMKLLADRRRMINLIYKGFATIANDQPIGPAYGADYCEKLEQREIDLDKAKFHINKSGISQATVHVADIHEGIAEVCMMIQMEAKKVGLNLEVKRVPTDGYWGSIWMKTPMFVTSINMRPTANFVLSQTLSADAPWNCSIWKNERFNKLLVEARSVMDKKLRKEMYCEMESLVRDNAGLIIPVFTNFIDAKAKKVKNLTSVPLAPCGGMEWPAQVWLDT